MYLLYLRAHTGFVIGFLAEKEASHVVQLVNMNVKPPHEEQKSIEHFVITY